MEKVLVETTKGERYILNNQFVCGVPGCCAKPKYIRGTNSLYTRTQVTKKFCKVHSVLYRDVNYKKYEQLKWSETIGLWDRSSELIPIMSKFVPDLKLCTSPSTIHSKEQLKNSFMPRVQEHIDSNNNERANTLIKSIGSQIEMDHVLGWKKYGDFVLPVCTGYHRAKTKMLNDNVVNNDTHTTAVKIAHALTDDILNMCEANFTQEDLLKAVS
jgi:hypothetical protein